MARKKTAPTPAPRRRQAPRDRSPDESGARVLAALDDVIAGRPTKGPVFLPPSAPPASDPDPAAVIYEARLTAYALDQALPALSEAVKANRSNAYHREKADRAIAYWLDALGCRRDGLEQLLSEYDHGEA